MKVFAISFVLLLGAVFADAFHSSSLNETLKPRNKLKAFRISEKPIAVIEQTHSRINEFPNGLDKRPHFPNPKRNHMEWIIPEQTSPRNHFMPNGLNEETLSPNWNDEQPKAVTMPKLNHVPWDVPQPAFSRTPVFPNGLNDRTPSSNWNSEQPIYIPNSNPKWIFPEHGMPEVLLEDSPERPHFLPRPESYGKTSTGNWNSGYHTLLGQLPQKSSKPDVDNFDMSHNTIVDRQQALHMDTHFIPNDLDKKSTSGNWKLPQDRYNLKRNSMGWIFPEHKDREVFKGHPLTKTNLAPNRESNGMTHPGYLEGGHQNFKGQTKWVSPISSIYVDYPGRKHNDWGVHHQQHQTKTHFLPNGMDRITPSDNWRQTQGMNNLKGNSIGWRRLDVNDREFSQGHPFKNTYSTPNRGSNDVTYHGNLKGGHQTFEGQTKWTSPISSVYVDYPGKMHNDWEVQHQMTLDKPKSFKLNQAVVPKDWEVGHQQITFAKPQAFKWNQAVIPNDWEVGHQQIKTSNSNAPSYDRNTWNFGSSASLKSKSRWVNTKSNSAAKWTNNERYFNPINYHNPETFSHYDFQPLVDERISMPPNAPSFYDVQTPQQTIMI